MSIRRITLDSMTVEGCRNFLAQLQPATTVTKYVVDFGGLTHVSPFGMLLCSHHLSAFRSANAKCEFEAVNIESHTYPGHMGFFQSFGAKFGKAPGEALGNDRYIPLTLISVEHIRTRASQNYQLVQAYLESLAKQLTNTLLQGTKSDVREALAFSLTEMFRNVVEHSRASQLGYCAQYWPTKRLVEVGVLDTGVGIREGLAANPFWKLQSDSHALHLALLPGVSGTAYQDAPRDTNDIWANAGYGLYMTSGICREAGSFLIVSGDASMRLEGKTKQNVDLSVAGTAIRLQIDISRLPKLSFLREQLIAYGDALAPRLRGTVVSSYAASRLVREGSPSSWN